MVDLVIIADVYKRQTQHRFHASDGRYTSSHNRHPYATILQLLRLAGQGRLRGGDDVFLVPVIKISELHNASSLKLRLVGWAAHQWAKTIKAL